MNPKSIAKFIDKIKKENPEYNFRFAALLNSHREWIIEFILETFRHDHPFPRQTIWPIHVATEGENYSQCLKESKKKFNLKLKEFLLANK